MADLLEAFTAEGFEVSRARTWDPGEVHRGGQPDALEVVVAPGQVAFALIVDEETSATYVLPPDLGSDREALGVARFSLTAGAGDGDRGAVGLVARVLLTGPGRKVINVLTGVVARAAASAWERRARPEQVRLFRPRDPAAGVPLGPEDWTRLGQGPSLLLLHGPFVQTSSGFSGLDRDLWNALADHYEGRVWGYDHHTISKTPRANARDLLRLAAEGGAGPMVVDVIGHSRGGLVARELTERPREGPISVRSLILAGTPNRGTPLADARGLVAGINRYTNLLALAPDPVTDIAGAVVAVVSHVLGEAVGELAGITAMAPPGPNPSYLSELNALPPAPDVSYRFVAGDYQPSADGSRLGRAFANWVVDSVLKEDANDVVVPASSALDADRVPEGTRETLAGVPHTGYWGSSAVTGLVGRWLLNTGDFVRAGTGSQTEPPVPTEPVTHGSAAQDTPVTAETSAPPSAPALDGATVQAATAATAATPASVETPDPVLATAKMTSAPHERSKEPSVLEVGLRHASLEHAPYVLLVGHFAGAPLSGAEGRLDERFGGRLTRLTLLNQYPRQLGEAVLLLPVDDDTPRGVMVLGLGPTGDLTGTQLSAVTTRGLLRIANQHMELRLAGATTLFPGVDGDPHRLGVTAVPIGTSWGGGLTFEGCVRALVAGVTAANDRLQRLMVPSGADIVPASEVVHFDRLEIVERYADRVDLLADALDRLADQAQRDIEDGGTLRVRFDPRPVRGEGASAPDPPLDPSEAVWRRVGISAVELPPANDATAHGALHLEFTSMGRLARAERLVSDIEPTVVEPLLERAIGRHTDPAISGTLYELLIPHQLKGELNDGENLHLLVDRTTAVYPWELLSARADEANPQVPLALRVGLLRQFQESQALRYDIRRAASNTILVVGNPPPGQGFAPLPGAAEEAKAVDALFRESGPGWGVESLVWGVDGERVMGPSPAVDQDPGEEVLHRFVSGDWRIVHIAAHGEITEDEATTGVVISGQFHLTARVFASLSVVPDLVFLNACHVGQIPNRDLRGMNRVAATVAESLLRIGVRAVIAAGWAVNDLAAKAFATTLYEDLLGGRHLGESVFRARQAAKRVARESLTWGAYQCYGDPGFQLVARQAVSQRRSPLTVSELRRRIQRLVGAASDQGRTSNEDLGAARKALELQLRDLRHRADQLDSPAALADLAEVYAELGRFDRAAALYRAAIRRGGRDVPLRALEQLGNMLSRWASRRVRHYHATLDDVRSAIDQAERWLQQAATIGPTEERLSLLGGFHKRCAVMTAGEERIRHLRSAVQGYADAQRLHDNGFQRNNWVQLYYVLTLIGPELEPEWIERYSVSATLEEAEDPEDAPYIRLAAPLDPNQGPPRPADEPRWQRFERGERLLTAGVVTGSLDVGRMVRAYRGAFRLRSSPRERASVVEHLDDLAALVPSELPLHSELVSALSQLEEASTIHPTTS